MEIKLASEMGFCCGVKRAINIIEKAAQKYGRLETLGPVVHNRQVVERLSQQGIQEIEHLEELHGPVVAIPAHGVGPQVLAELKARNFTIVDATCLMVRRVQRAAQKLAQAGFYVVVFGDPEHSEVIGVLGWTGEKGRAVLTPEEVADCPRRLGIISQTTQSPSRFADFVKGVVDTCLGLGSEIHVVNTVCQATLERQAACLELAQDVDLMLVVGSPTSANTRRLAEVCATAGVEIHLMEKAADLDGAWLVGRERVGVTAGASTPDEVVGEVVQRLEALGQVSRSTKDALPHARP